MSVVLGYSVVGNTPSNDTERPLYTTGGEWGSNPHIRDGIDDVFIFGTPTIQHLLMCRKFISGTRI